MRFKIKSRWTGEILFAVETDSLKLAVELAVEKKADLGGADLRRADLGGADLRRANLREADLGEADLRRANLRGADLGGADLRRAYLRGADLGGADLGGADLRRANLREADLGEADLGEAEIPVIQHIDAAILAAVRTDGHSLKMKDWHICEMAHCRGGWAIKLAGKAGEKLESALGADAAASLIYAASRPKMRVPDFYCTDAQAMTDLESCAAEDPFPQEQS